MPKDAILTLKTKQEGELFQFKRFPSKFIIGKLSKNGLLLMKSKLVLKLNVPTTSVANITQDSATVRMNTDNEFNQKRLKSTQKRIKNEIKVDNLEHDLLEINQVLPAITETLASNCALQDMQLMINMDATNVQDIYSLDYYFKTSDNFEVKDLWKSKDSLTAKQNMLNMNIKEQFCMQKVMEILQQKELFKKIGLKRVVMISIMMQVYKLSTKREFKLFKLTKNTELVQFLEQEFLEKVGSGYKVSKKNRDKILLFIVIEILLINNYIIDLDLVVKDLGSTIEEYSF